MFRCTAGALWPKILIMPSCQWCSFTLFSFSLKKVNIGMCCCWRNPGGLVLVCKLEVLQFWGELVCFRRRSWYGWVAEEQERDPKKGDIFKHRYFYVCWLLPGGNVIYQISKVPICRDLRDVEKSGGLILIHIRFLRLQELSGSKRIDSKAS